MGGTIDPVGKVSGKTASAGSVSTDTRTQGAGSTASRKGVSEAPADGFVHSDRGELGINQDRLRQKFLTQYDPQYSGNQVTDQAREDFEYSKYVNQQYTQKADEVFSRLKNLPPEEQEKSRAFLREVDEKATEEARRMGLSPDQAKEYKNLMMFRALAEKYNGTELGDRSREAFVLGSYDRDLYNVTRVKYGMPDPGQANPYNPQGQDYYNNAGSIQDQLILEQIRQQQMLQFLILMSLFNSSGMGFAPFMLAPWMM